MPKTVGCFIQVTVFSESSLERCRVNRNIIAVGQESGFNSLDQVGPTGTNVEVHGGGEGPAYLGLADRNAAGD